MRCPLCSGEVPERSRFCLHCGSRIDTFNGQAIEWEYHDFALRFPPNVMYVRLGGNSGYTEAGAGIAFWSKSQDYLEDHLKGWFRQGWQPSEELGPDNIATRVYEQRGRDNKRLSQGILAIIGAVAALILVSIAWYVLTPLAWLLILLLMLVGVALLIQFLSVDRIAEPLEFHAQLRRAKWEPQHSLSPIVCSYCGRANLPDDYVCDGCGAPLPAKVST